MKIAKSTSVRAKIQKLRKVKILAKKNTRPKT